MKTLPLPLLAFFATNLLLACGSDVDVASTSGAGGSSASSTSTGSGGGCAGSPPFCTHGCGSDWLEQSICPNGTWTCPPDTIDPNECPPGTCWGPPLPCEVCMGGWACAPEAACIGSCSAFVCATCEGTAPGTTQIGACQCSCNNNEYGCTLAPGCCHQDVDCGDKQLFPCVNNVCKQPVTGACWADIECGAGMKCQGAIVCPCGAFCDAPDTPGMCVPL